MKYSLIIGFTSLLYCSVSAQTINWKQATNWRLYNIRESIAFNYSADTLAHFKSVSLNEDTMKMFMANTTKWPKEKTSVWMGLYVAACELPGNELRKVEISVYGGFFYDDKTKTYYQLPEEIRNEWLEYISDKSSTITSQ